MEHLITALRAGRLEHTPESEPVLVAVDGGQATLTLDDGETLAFDVAELTAALVASSVTRRAA